MSRPPRDIPPTLHFANSEGGPACNRPAGVYQRPVLTDSKLMVTCKQCQRMLVARSPRKRYVVPA